MRAILPQLHRLIGDGPAVGSNWSRVLDGTVGDAEGWPEPELHWEKARLDHAAPILLADELKHWWECPACPGLITALPGVEEASRPQAFQARRITAAAMPQVLDEQLKESAMRWGSDSVASSTEPTTTGQILYIPQAFATEASCEVRPT